MQLLAVVNILHGTAWSFSQRLVMIVVKSLLAVEVAVVVLVMSPSQLIQFKKTKKIQKIL